jgi:methionyl-tRNA synthetase
MPNWLVLGHELIHADLAARGKQLRGGKVPYTYTDQLGQEVNSTARQEELAVSGIAKSDEVDITEQDLRAEHGLPDREAYVEEVAVPLEPEKH